MNGAFGAFRGYRSTHIRDLSELIGLRDRLLLHPDKIDKWSFLRIRILNQGVRTVEVLAVSRIANTNSKMITVVCLSHLGVAANNKNAAVLFLVTIRVSAGVRVILDIAQALVTVDSIESLIQAKIRAAIERLRKYVAVHVNITFQSIERGDVEAAGCSELPRCLLVTVILVLIALKGVLSGVQRIGIVAICARFRIVTRCGQRRSGAGGPQGQNHHDAHHNGVDLLAKAGLALVHVPPLVEHSLTPPLPACGDA